MTKITDDWHYADMKRTRFCKKYLQSFEDVLPDSETCNDNIRTVRSLDINPPTSLNFAELLDRIKLKGRIFSMHDIRSVAKVLSDLVLGACIAHVHLQRIIILQSVMFSDLLLQNIYPNCH